MTLCRYDKQSRPGRPEQELDPGRFEPFTVSDVRLMRSVLLPGGAEHREIRSVAL